MILKDARRVSRPGATIMAGTAAGTFAADAADLPEPKRYIRRQVSRKGAF